MLNKNSKSKSVIVKELFGTTVSTRQAVQELAKRIPAKVSKVVVDFDKVEFVSRSFAHEFLHFQEKLSVEVKNLSPDVEKMFEAVRKSAFHRKRDDEITNSSVSLSDLSSHF